MANYPNTSTQSALGATFTQLRKGFPSKVDSGYLQRVSIAPGNESYIIAILRFLGLIDEEGNQIRDNTGFFYQGDEDFKRGLEAVLRDAYSQLFDEMGDEALTAQRDSLTNWFRRSDKTSELVGHRQASTFQTLSALAGHGELPTARANGAKKSADPSAAIKKATPPKIDRKQTPDGGDGGARGPKPQTSQDVGLTVRIEVNLPPDGDAETYDAIFASIKKHLMS